MARRKQELAAQNGLQWEQIAMAMADVPSRPPILSVLKSSTLLNAIDEGVLMSLAKCSHLAYAERGETIWIRGDTVDFFGLVGTGFVKMVRTTTKGQEVTAELMGPGQIFGLLGVIEGSGCPLSSRAVSNTWYLKIPKEAFLPIFGSNQLLKDALIRRTTLRLRLSPEMMAKMAVGTVSDRIALILYVLAESYGEQIGETIKLRVQLTRQDISEMAGTTVETTIRVMSKWQKKGIVSTDHRYVTIEDPERLFGSLDD